MFINMEITHCILVKACQGNIFFNKKFNLVYGKHLKQLISRGVVVKILFYKKPSHLHKVKYKKAIDDLYKAEMSNDKEEDNKIKKTLANIAFGMLEKSFNRKTVSKMFDGIKEALNHQKKYGGKIYVMDELEKEKYWNGESWMMTGLLDLRMADHIFNTNMVVFHTHILITKLRMV